MSEHTYKIGEAAQLLKLKSYVLRFWETEFPQLTPLRTEKGQRLYSEADLELLKFIRHLLHERGLTIEGARKVLQSRADSDDFTISSDFLDESYKDFADESVLPQSLETPAAQTAENTILARQAAQNTAQKRSLEHTLQELKKIEALLREPKFTG